MKTLINISKIFSKKSGKGFIILKVFDSFDSNVKNVHSLDEILAIPDSEGAVISGQNVDEYILDLEDVKNGKIEIDGKLVIGSEVRVFLEGNPGRVTYIKASKK